MLPGRNHVGVGRGESTDTYGPKSSRVFQVPVELGVAFFIGTPKYATVAPKGKWRLDVIRDSSFGL
jgi:hypothetical protein